MRGSLYPPISTSTEKMRRPFLSMRALRPVAVALDDDALAHLLGQSGSFTPAAEAHLRARATELEVQEIGAHDFAVATEQAEAAFHVPRRERGLADVDDVHHGDGVLGLEEIERRRQHTARRGGVGLPVDVEALLDCSSLRGS